MTTPQSQRSELLRQFFVFGVIGTAGFVVDTSVLYLAMGFMGLDHYSGRVVSWFVAATFTWAMNRRFTFSDSRPPFRQWLAFLASNAVGGLVNFGIYAAMVTFMPSVRSSVGRASNSASTPWDTALPILPV